MDHLSLNFSDLYVGLLNRMKEEFNLESPGVVCASVNPGNAQTNNQLALSPGKNPSKSSSIYNIKFGMEVGPSFCMVGSNKEINNGKCMEMLDLLYMNSKGSSICMNINSLSIKGAKLNSTFMQEPSASNFKFVMDSFDVELGVVTSLFLT